MTNLALDTLLRQFKILRRDPIFYNQHTDLFHRPYWLPRKFFIVAKIIRER